MDELIDAMVNMKEKDALILAERRLNQGDDPLAVLDLCHVAVEYIGKQFELGNYFLPELIMAGEMVKAISKLAEPFIKGGTGETVEPIGRVIIGSVQGDIHDIGKDIVIFMLEVNGFKVHDLGVDVSPDKFVEAVRDIQPQIVGMSALLTTVFDSFKHTVEAIAEAGCRDKVKIMIGGGTVTDEVRQYSGADAYGEDAMAAVNHAKRWVGII